MTDLVIIFCTCGTHDEALIIANSLIEARLAACVNILPPVHSIYRWQGKVETAHEVLLIVKTTQQRFPEVRDRITQLHSYDTPEVLAMPIIDGSDKYLAWFRSAIQV
jgi:periplasmic divalent cation tolerance protein